MSIKISNGGRHAHVFAPGEPLLSFCITHPLSTHLDKFAMYRNQRICGALSSLDPLRGLMPVLRIQCIFRHQSRVFKVPKKHRETYDLACDRSNCSKDAGNVAKIAVLMFAIVTSRRQVSTRPVKRISLPL
jgi:hypothetical protein